MRMTLPQKMFCDADQSRLSMLRTWVLDNDVAATDVIAEPIEARGFFTDEEFELIGFLDAPIGNFDR